MFRRKPRAAAVRGPGIRDPFEVMPLAPANVEVRRDSRGRIHLRLNFPVAGLRKRVAGWLGYDYSRKLELDEQGTLYYGMVDGNTTLRQIVSRMAAQTAAPEKQIEEQVILFTKKLMTMDLVALKVPASNQVRAAGA